MRFFSLLELGSKIPLCLVALDTQRAAARSLPGDVEVPALALDAPHDGKKK